MSSQALGQAMTDAEFRKLRLQIWTERFFHQTLWFSRHKSKRMTQSVMNAIDFVFR